MEIKKRQFEIINAAGEILTTSGVGGLTIKKLAEKMGFAESALYRHFKNKEDIILTMLDYLAETVEEKSANSLNENDPPDVQLQALFNTQFIFFKKNPHLVVAILSDGLLAENAVIDEAVLRIMNVMRSNIVQIVKRGQQQHIFTKNIAPDDMVHIIMGSLRLFLLQWRLSDFSFDIKTRGNKLLSAVITLIKVQHEK